MQVLLNDCVCLFIISGLFLSVTVAWQLQQHEGDWQIQDTVGGVAVGTVLLHAATIHGRGSVWITETVYVSGERAQTYTLRRSRSGGEQPVSTCGRPQPAGLHPRW